MATRGKRGNYQFLNHISPKKGVYTLIVRQQPVKSKVSPIADKTGAGEKKTIDPAVIVELRISDQDEKPASSDPVHYLYNPFLFAYATLLDPESLEEMPYMDDSMHILTGSIASCVYHLKDPENDNQFGAFFVFPDIAIRQEGKFRLKISLFKITGNSEDPSTTNSKVVLLQSVTTNVFQVYAIKGFPPLLPSSLLSRSFADQGLKLRLRKNTKSDCKKDDDDSSDNESPRAASAPSTAEAEMNINMNRKRMTEAPTRGRYPPEPYGAHPYYYRPPPMGYAPYPPPGTYGQYNPYYYPAPPGHHHDQLPNYPPAGYPSHERSPYQERPPSSYPPPPRPDYHGHYDNSYHPHYPPPHYPSQRSASGSGTPASATSPSQRPYPFPPIYSSQTHPQHHHIDQKHAMHSKDDVNGRASPRTIDINGIAKEGPSGSDVSTRLPPRLPGPEELLKKEEEVVRRLTSSSTEWEHAAKKTRLDNESQGTPSSVSENPATSATSIQSLPLLRLPSDRPRRLSIPGRGDPSYLLGGPSHHYPLPPPSQHLGGYPGSHYYGYPPPGSYGARPRPPPGSYPPPPPQYAYYPHPGSEYMGRPPSSLGRGYPLPHPNHMHHQQGPSSAPAASISLPPVLPSPSVSETNGSAAELPAESNE